MSFLYLLIKLYPFFGLSFAFLSFDFAKNLRRKGNLVWILFVFLLIDFLTSTIAWLVMRGDQNADSWYADVQKWIDPSSANQPKTSH